MDKRGKGTDHNLRVEDRNILRVEHETRLAGRSARPLMYICEKCGYLEFYVPMKFGKSTKTERKNVEKRKVQDSGEYYT
jgi:predicted nucleic-acid-binding Zn-ribbon protein